MNFLRSNIFLAVGILALIESITGFYFPKLFVIHEFITNIMGAPVGPSEWSEVQKTEYRIKTAKKSLRLGLIIVSIWAFMKFFI